MSMNMSSEYGQTVRSSLPAAIAERAVSDGDRVWLEDVSGRTATYREALEASLLWADAYRRAGVEEGDVVVTMQLNTFEYLYGGLGLSWLRAIESPINTDYRGDLLRHVLGNTRANVMLLRQEYISRVAELAGELEHLEKLIVVDPIDEALPELPFEVLSLETFLADAAPGATPEPPDPWDTATVMYTSGTTGPSKGVIMPWGHMHAWTLMWDPEGDLGPENVFYAHGPTYHIMGKMFPYLAALVGGSVYMRPFIHVPSAPEDFERVTFGLLFPNVIDDWLSRPESPRDRDVPLQSAFIFQHPRLDEFKKRFGVRTIHLYNLTEGGCPIRDAAWDTHHFDAEGRLSCGPLRRGYPGHEVRVVDEHDQEVSPGTMGELIIRSAVPWTMNAGYLNMPEATAKAWRNGWFHTGDGVVLDEDGYYYFRDRIKDAIRRRGENISSYEVESYVSQHPAVAECAAIAVKEKGLLGGHDEEVKVCIVLHEGERLGAEELIEFLIPRMPRFMIPRYVEFVEELPKTPTTKVRKVVLRKDPMNAHTWDREAAGIVLPRTVKSES